MITVARLAGADRAGWNALFQGYNAFYSRTLPPVMYERAWGAVRQGDPVHGCGAWVDGQLVGIAHFLTHPSTTAADVCYLQDLFTAPQARGQGVATALIEQVAQWAAGNGCSRVYWMTHETNTTARRLYDRLARFHGFIRYEISL